VKDNYWRHSPVEGVNSRTNPSKYLKEIVEAEGYMQLLRTPCLKEEIKNAFIFCCYTGLRFVDCDTLEWARIRDNQLTTRIIQRKTGKPVVLTLHPIAMAILEKRRRLPGYSASARVFNLPTLDGYNEILQQWVD